MKALALVLLLFTATTAEGRIRQTSMGGDIDLQSAPDGASLRTMGGDIRVASARGHVVAKTMGGDIEVRNLDGSIEAGTMGGNVEVQVVSKNGGGDVEISSMGGSIEVTLPANFSGDFDVELERDENDDPHEIVSDFPLHITQREKNRWWGPDAIVFHGTGTAGSGANRVRITTIGGDIRIRKR
jgi:DUF4097 and DUF4098 domain-containing protein YvlB